MESKYLAYKYEKKEDLEYGLEQEKIVMPLLSKFYNKELRKSTNQFAKYDFKCIGLRIELKSRRKYHNDYRTAFITKIKTDWAKNHPQYKYVIFFNYLDGLYYIDYDEVKFSKYKQTKTFVEKRNEWVMNLEIPSNELINMETGKTDQQELLASMFASIKL